MTQTNDPHDSRQNVWWREVDYHQDRTDSPQATLSAEWDDPTALRARIAHLERRVSDLETRHSRTNGRPGCITVYVCLMGLGMILGLCMLTLLLSDSPYCTDMDEDGQEECGTFGEQMAGETHISAGTWTGILVAALIYQGFLMYGLWNMRLWGWWLAVIAQLLAILQSLCNLSPAAAITWILSGVVLWWFFRNKQRFGRAEAIPSGYL
jgi:hypothetical protein